MADPLSLKINPVTGIKYTKEYYAINRQLKDLPILEAYDELREKIDRADVLIIESATGSGKTICVTPMLERIYNYKKRILLSQPRTVNIVSTVEIIAKQLDINIGTHIGYQFSGGHIEAKKGIIHVVTDYFLIKLIDEEFDIFIVDEVHERKMTMDIFMTAMKMYFRNYVPDENKPKKKLILLSATLDVGKFVDYYEGVANVEHMKVSGRAKPIYSIWMGNIAHKAAMKQYERSIIEVVDDLISDVFLQRHWKNITKGNTIDIVKDNTIPERNNDMEMAKKVDIWDSKDGDILVFVPTQSLINKFVAHYAKKKSKKTLYIGLSRATNTIDRERATGLPEETYKKDGYSRRVIFSTPIAETGVTISGIKFVIESGIQNMVTYNPLEDKRIGYIDWVKKASATQRCGRAGRQASGICIRLYSKDRYEKKFKSTISPEIYNEPLHNLILYLLEYVESLTMALLYIDNLPDKVHGERLREAIAELNHHGLIGENAISEKGRAVLQLGLPFRYALLIVEGFRYGIGKYMAAIVALLSSCNYGNVATLFGDNDDDDDDDKSKIKVLIKLLRSDSGDPIVLLKIYQLLSDTFIRTHQGLIGRSHKRIRSYVEDKYEWIDHDVMLYHSHLMRWCKKYGFNFHYIKRVIPKILKIQKNIITRIGHEAIYVEKRWDNTTLLEETIMKIFIDVYYRNRAVWIEKQYVLNDGTHVGIPSSLFVDYRGSQKDLPKPKSPLMIGYVDIMYFPKHYPQRGYRALMTCPFVILRREEDDTILEPK